MSEAEKMILRAKLIRARLINPPNAVLDPLNPPKGWKPPEKNLPPPPKEKIQQVLEHRVACCHVSILEQGPPQTKRLKLKQIFEVVAAEYGATIAEIKGEARCSRYVRPRHVAIYLATKHTGLSMAAIGRVLNRDHTTIIHACRKTKKRLASEPILASIIAKLEAELFRDSNANLHRPAVAAFGQSDLALQSREGPPKQEIRGVEQTGGLDYQVWPVSNDNRSVQGQNHPQPAK